MEKYAPLIFEECLVKSDGPVRMASAFEVEQNAELRKKADPSRGLFAYKGMHLFVMCHGFHGSSFDVRTFKNVISIALPDALFLCAEANEKDSD